MDASLEEYERKREFEGTTEPEPGPGDAEPEKRQFVIQKHQATTLHYDFRLSDEGVLKSWAVTKEPPTKAGVKRLAVRTEDHPYAYINFEGTIPEGHYGAGTVEIWDKGEYQPLLEDGSVSEALKNGALKFLLNGKRLKGRYVLYRFDDKGDKWFFFRTKDK